MADKANKSANDNFLINAILSLFGGKPPAGGPIAAYIDDDMTPEEMEYLRKVGTQGQSYGYNPPRNAGSFIRG